MQNLHDIRVPSNHPGVQERIPVHRVLFTQPPEERVRIGEHVLLETQASMDLCWRKWRRNMTWSDIGKALKAGDLAPMTENICVLEKRR